MPHFACPCCGSSNPTIDHFAPVYIVGNIPNGDPPIPQLGNFRYIPDPGDGSGIQLAYTEAALSPGDIHIRPGLYDFGILSLGPLTIPDKCNVKGAGRTTVIQGSKVTDQGIFIVGADSTLADMTINGGSATDGPPGSLALIVVKNTNNLLENLFVTLTTNGPFITKYGIHDIADSPTPPVPSRINKYNNVHIELIFPFDSQDAGNPASCLVHSSPANSGLVDIFESEFIGGVRGVFIDGGITFINTCIMQGQKEFGIINISDSFLRIVDSIILGPGEEVNYIGVRSLKGAGFLLDNSVVVNPSGTQADKAIYLGSPDGIIAPIINNCFITGFTIGILLGDIGDNVFGGMISGNTGLGFTINAIRVNNTASTVKIYDNLILMPGGTSQVAIQIDGGQYHTVSDNKIEQFLDNAFLTPAISNRSISTNISGNRVSYAGGAPAVSSSGEHCQIVGNFIEKTNIDIVAALLVSGYGTTVSANAVLCNVDQASTVAPIEIRADLCAVTGNKTRSAPALKAINLFASNCTAIGNACEGPGGLPIGDFGAGNIYDTATAALQFGFNSWT